MDGHGDRASIRVFHEVVTAGDPLDGESRLFESLDYLRSRYDREATWHKSGRYYNSGDVECQSEFVGYADLFDQQLKPGPQIGDRFFLRRAIADSADTGPQQGGGAPYAVLILLDRIGHVNDSCHKSSIACVLSLRSEYTFSVHVLTSRSGLASPQHGMISP